MTEKELRKLRRQDFLQLLLMQGNELKELQQTLEQTQAELALAQQSNERIKTRLDEKDALIEKLKSRLDAKDVTIRKLVNEMSKRQSNRRIELEEAGSIAAAALKLNGVFEAAQKAADQYLYNLKLLVDAYGPRPPRPPEGTVGPGSVESAADKAADAELKHLLQVNAANNAADRKAETGPQGKAEKPN